MTYTNLLLPIHTNTNPPTNIIVLITGSSAGSEDFTPALTEELGELLVHVITVMPGKPLLLDAVDGWPLSASTLPRRLFRSTSFHRP